MSHETKDGAEVDLTGQHGGGQPPHLPIRILINNRPYEAPKTPMTVQELKALAGLAQDFSFYQVVQNKNVGPLPSDRELDLHPGDRFTCTRGEDPS